MTDFRGLYDIRDMREADKNFILSTFLKGVHYGNSWFSLIPKDIFMENYTVIITSMLNNPMNLVSVACLKDDPDTIIGYSILSLDLSTAHWVYVKRNWRLRKVGTSLVPTTVKTATHMTDAMKPLLKKFNIIFNPFSLT